MRTLRLKKETMQELATDELAQVVGAGVEHTLYCTTFPVNYCLLSFGCPDTV